MAKNLKKVEIVNRVYLNNDYLVKKKDCRKCLTNAKIELEHILVEIQNERYNHLRHFMDSWFCYSNGYVVNKDDVCNPNWDFINYREWVSESALLYLNEFTPLDKTTKIIKEHIVPVKEFEKILKKETSTEGIKEQLKKNLIFAVITNKDEETLNKNGFKEKMPDKWEHPLDRYKQSNINLIKINWEKKVDGKFVIDQDKTQEDHELIDSLLK